MTVTEPEPQGTDERISQAMVQFVGCIGGALPDICSYGWTYGEAYVPFDPDEDEDCDSEDVPCSQAWVRIMGIGPTPQQVQGWEPACGMGLTLDLEVGVIRCVEIPEKGEAPTTTGVLLAASQSVTDMNSILCAALSCEVWEYIEVGEWSPMGPLGGQHGGTWTFSVEI